MEQDTRTVVYEWNVNNKKDSKSLKLTVVCAVIFMSGLAIALSDNNNNRILTDLGFIGYSAMWLGILLVIVAIHELLHGLFFWLFAGRVKFGIKWKTKLGITPYASCPNGLFTKRQFQAIGAAPQILSGLLFCAALIVWQPWSNVLILTAAANVAGGCADLWLIWKAEELEDDAMIEDVETGIKVWKMSKVG